MDIVGLDLHKRESQLASTAPDGTITDRRIVTSRDRLTAVFGDRPRARILLEASTENEWVARLCRSSPIIFMAGGLPVCAPSFGR